MTTLSSDRPKANFKTFNLFEHIKFEHLAAGVSGGVIANLVLHPLDIVKIRFAVNDGRENATPKYRGIRDAFSTIYKNEGVRGLYRGVTPNVVGAGAAWGFYFLFYNGIKHFLQKGNSDVQLGPATHLLAASEAGFITLLITNPLWVVKTRLCLQYSLGGKQVQTYNGMVDCLVKIYKADGFLGYYKGLAPGIFGVSHGAVQFMVYEELKNTYNYYYDRPISAKLGTLEYLSFSAGSKLVAVCTTYPYQVVRARLQNQHYSYEGSVHCVRQTLRYEGWRGFYKGMGTNLIRVTPATMITFLVYENVAHVLLRYSGGRQQGPAAM